MSADRSTPGDAEMERLAKMCEEEAAVWERRCPRQVAAGEYPAMLAADWRKIASILRATPADVGGERE